MITIRPAKESDLTDILAIYNEIIAHTAAVFEYDPHTLDMRKLWYETKLKEGYPVFVALESFSSFDAGAKATSAPGLGGKEDS